MKKKVYQNFALTTALILFLGFSAMSQNAWINEFHYDNDGGDVGEFVEVVIENPGNYTLSDFSVYLYNGNGGETYDNESLDQFTTGSSSGNFTIYYMDWSGIQNGAPDGLALVYNGQSKWDNAIESCNKALTFFKGEETTKDAKIYYELGNAYKGKGDTNAACEAYKKAAKGDYAEHANYEIEHTLKCNK